MNYRKLILLIPFTLLMAGCKPAFPGTKQDRKEKANWEAVVNTPATDNAIKSYWEELISNRWAFFKQHQSSFTAADFLNLKFLHVVTYDIDSSQLFAYRKSQSIGSIVTLNKRRIVSFVVKNDSIVAMVYPKLSEGKWQNGGGYSVPFKAVAQRIIETYRANGEVYWFDVYAFPSTSYQPFRSLLVAYIDKKLLNIGIDGSVSSLDDELMKIKKQALLGAEVISSRK